MSSKEEPIPAPGGPGVQNVVNQPETPRTQPGQPVQPGHTSAEPVMLGEDPQDKQDRAVADWERRQAESAPPEEEADGGE